MVLNFNGTRQLYSGKGNFHRLAGKADFELAMTLFFADISIAK
jgi:hypothetical protein